MPSSTTPFFSGNMNDTRTSSTPDGYPLPSSASFSLIYSLPDELMSLIFVFAVSRAVFVPMPPTKEWWSIPWVNRHFRRIALQTPRFWAALVFNNEELLDSMLSRSGTTPMTVCFDDRHHGLLEQKRGDDHLGIVLLKKALVHLARVEILTICGNRRTIEHARQLLQGRGVAHKLRRCSITCYESWDTLPPARQVDLPRVVAFSDDLFVGQAPYLRALHLHEVQISWTSPILSPSIVVLVLTTPSSVHPGDPVLMLNALARMPELRYLVLLPPSLPFDGTPTQRPPRMSETVVFSSMRHCILVMDLEDTQAILEALVMPQTTEMRMIGNAPGGMEDITFVEPMAQGLHKWYAQQQSVGPTSQLFAARVQAYTVSAADNLRVSTSWERQPELLSDSGPTRAPDAPSLVGMSADVVVAHVHGSDLLLSIAMLLLRSLPISGVRELIVDCGLHRVTPVAWRFIAELMPFLETVVLHGHNASDSFFDVLASWQTGSGANEHPADALPLLRNLRNLSLNGLDLAYPPRCTIIARGLRQMERAHRRIQKLCLRACNIPRMRLLELQVHVEMMIVDEREREP